jgi:hypothetical protein
VSVDLGDFIESLKREVNPPGTDDFPDALEDEWVGNLSDAFWEARLDGLLTPYTETDGVVTPIDPTGAEFGRDMVQLVILYASRGFNASVFRTAITDAMTMGLPNSTSERITFVFDEVRTFADESPANNPYDWTSATVTDTAETTLQVPAAIQWGLGTLSDTTIGQFDASKAVVTLLDTHYVIDSVGPPVGLFDVTVYTLHITARG